MSNNALNSKNKVQPGLPLPPPITSEQPGTWAHSTMSTRVRDIGRRTLAENRFSEEVSERIEALITEIPGGPIRQLSGAAPDADAWMNYTQPYIGRNWLTPPWFFTETYFYRRLIEASGFYTPGPGFGRDPFSYQKEQGLLATEKTTAEIATHLQRWIDGGPADKPIAALLAIDLWGNRADLSLWPANEGGEQPMDIDWEAAKAFTLADDTEAVVQHLHGRSRLRIDLIADNAGLELVADLALADYLLSSGVAGEVFVHLKPHPTFVSDAMIKDVRETVVFLSGREQTDVCAFGRRLGQHIRSGRLLLAEDAFWVSPLALWEMPGDLRADLGRSDLIISKGDANYRRLLGDRQWPYTTPFADIVSYTPAPLLALRGLKAELACGLTAEQIERLEEEDPTWLVNGRWGVIQFARPGGSGTAAGQ